MGSPLERVGVVALGFGLPGLVIHGCAGAAAVVAGNVEHHVLTATGFVNRRDAIGVAFERLVPKDFAGFLVVSAESAVAAPGQEDQTAGGHDGPVARAVAAGPVDSFFGECGIVARGHAPLDDSLVEIVGD